MKRCFILAFGAVLALASGCGKEANPGSEPGTGHSVTLRVSDNSTRAIFDPYGAFHWQTGDKIGVSTVGGTELGALTLDHTTSGNVVTGTEPVCFNGEIDGEIGVLAGKNRANFNLIFINRLNGAFCPSRRGLPLRSFS